MIKFKTLKYKHYKWAQTIYEGLDDNEAVLDDIVKFAAMLVAEWDFVDGDTGESLPPGDKEVIDELSLEQFKELFREFNAKMGFDVRLADENGPADQAQSEVEIPKASAEPSPSG